MSDESNELAAVPPMVQAIVEPTGRAAILSRGEVFIPTGRPVVIVMNPPPGLKRPLLSIKGTLVAMDDRWACLTDAAGNVRLIDVRQITMLSTNLSDGPQPQEWRVGTESDMERDQEARMRRAHRSESFSR